MVCRGWCAPLRLLRLWLRLDSGYLVAIIGPATELHVAMLVIKGEPCNVYLACALEDAGRHVQAATVMSNHDVCVVRPVEPLVRTMTIIVHIYYTTTVHVRVWWGRANKSFPSLILNVL